MQWRQLNGLFGKLKSNKLFFMRLCNLYTLKVRFVLRDSIFVQFSPNKPLNVVQKLKKNLN